MRIAILDDYQSVALTMADWSPLAGRAEISVFTDHLADETDLVERLAPFDVLCIMRERTALRRSLIELLRTDEDDDIVPAQPRSETPAAKAPLGVNEFSDRLGNILGQSGNSAILAGRIKGPKRDIAVFNAAAGFVITSISPDLDQAKALAESLLDRGAAHAKLKSLVEWC